jgi:hypothetical protein
MGLLDTNYQDQRLTASQKKKIKPAIQGGGYNYLGEQEEVTVPRKWLSDPDHVVAELVYITPREKKVLIDLNMYGSLDGKPNNAPGGLPSLQGDMGGTGGSSGGGNSGGGGGGGGRDYSPPSKPTTKPSAPPSKPTTKTSTPPGGGNDMQVSGAEAAYSKEKGISTAADTRISNTSFSRGNNEITGRNEIDTADSKGNIVTSTIGYGAGQVDPRLAQATLVADTSNVGIAAPNYSSSEIEKGYTDTGEILSNVNGKFMTKADMYNTGIIAKDPATGKDVMGNKTIDPQTGDIIENPANATFIENFQNLPNYIPPTLRFLMAGGKSLNNYMDRSGFMGFNEAGQRGLLGNAALGYGQSRDSNVPLSNFNTGDSNRDLMNRVAADAPYIVNPNLTRPDSVAQQYFNNLTMSQSSPLSSSLQTSYNNAKTTINNILGITPPSQQFGYSADPYGGLMASNLTTNPYNIDYLKRLGLI